MDGELTYSYKATSFGAPWVFTLKPDGISCLVGTRGGTIPYAKIRRVRLLYRPVAMQTHRFLAEIWSDGAPKLRLASATWRGIAEQARQDDAYVPFIVELHRRIAASGAKAEFVAGLPPILFWIGVATFIALGIALASFAVQALRLADWGGALFVAAFFALFVWQLGGYLTRNQPARYTPDAIPARVMPRLFARGASATDDQH